MSAGFVTNPEGHERGDQAVIPPAPPVEAAVETNSARSGGGTAPDWRRSSLAQLTVMLLLILVAFAAGWAASRAVAGQPLLPAEAGDNESAIGELNWSAVAAPAIAEQKAGRGSAQQLAALPDPARELFAEMNRLHEEMDRRFERAFGRFHGTPEFERLLQSSFVQTMNVRDEGDRYVAEVELPDRNLEHLDVKLEGQLLRVEMAQEKTEAKNADQGGALNSKSHFISRFQQAVTLPEPVKADQMKTDRSEGRLVVTIPKANG